ncbi:MAG: ATP-binding cassette domain-containing protein [Planctomycetota bacterium]
MTSVLRLRGAREHNLRDVDLDLPLGTWIAVVGPSGSGKTSLVVDTIVREGQRRFLSGLSARARQFHGKLGRAALEGLDGLPAAVAIGAQSGSDNPRSTVGTSSGTLDFLRLLFAREAVDPRGQALTRSHFSSNHPLGACEACGGLGVEDRVDPDLLVADPTRSIRAGALKPTLKNGYTVYSQVTVEVMDQVCRAHGFDVDTAWEALTDAQRHVILYGTQALKVPFGKHSIESRMRWEGITARPREEGYYRGLVPVIQETLERNRNPNILRFVATEPCSECNGSRLARPGREAALAGRRLPELLALAVPELRVALGDFAGSPVWEALRPSVELRLERMERLDLAHLSLDRPSETLSGGEGQRLRLVGQLAAGLGRQLIAFDEPTLGLHPGAQDGMRAVLDELRDLGNTVLVVEHDPDMVRHADHLVRIGPGAGVDGGRVVEAGPLEASDDAAGPLGSAPPRKPKRRPGRGRLRLVGATLHNLRGADLDLRLGALNVVCGPSGAGKSSLVFGTLLPALQGDGRAPFDRLEGAPDGGVQAVDARPIGRTPRSTPATWSGLFDLVRKRFAAESLAVERGWGAGRFSYNNKEGRCSSCDGLGFQRVGLHLMEDVELDCAACGGGRFAPETLAVRHRGKHVAEVLAMSVEEATAFFADDEPIAALCRAMQALGLGYLGLGHASNRLSRGEAQRVKLATQLGTAGARPSLLLLDEPDRGLHPSDVELLLRAFDALVEAGHTVVAISHHRHLWAAADAVTEVLDGRTRDDVEPRLEPLTHVRGARPVVLPPSEMRLEGVATHNLRGFDVAIPHGQLTVVAGPSGSGKSSLVFDTLAAEAWARYAEGLPFQVRRFVRRAPRPRLEGASGLGPTLALRQGQAKPGARSTVATQSDLGPALRLLWARAGRLDGEPTGWSASHFSTEQPVGACPACEGRARVARGSVERLVTHPHLSLADGALQGTKPGRFFSEVGGQHLATLRAALEAEGFAPSVLDDPWEAWPTDARELALRGAGDRVLAVEWTFERGKRAGTHHFEGPWDGLLPLVEREARRRASSQKAEEWRTPLVDVPCEGCGGSGLRPESARVELDSLTLPAALALTVDALGPTLEALALDTQAAAVRAALLPEIGERLDDLRALGLGHLSLDRRSQSLSEGELQRVRLAALLRAGLTGVTFALDEPGSGLHPRDLEALVARLRRLCADGNTVVAVSHRPEVLRAADHWIELGPGAGADGGQLLDARPAAVAIDGDGPTARALREPLPTRAARHGSTAEPRLLLRGVRANNLTGFDVSLPASGFLCLTGVSGSGKSSLLFDVLGASMAARAPVECEAVEWTEHASSSPLEHFDRVVRSRDVGGGQTVLGALGLMPSMQALFRSVVEGPEPKKAAFSYLSPAGRCEACKGSGREEVALDVLANLALPCPACAGTRYRPSVLEVRWRGRHVAQFLAEPVAVLREELPSGKLRTALEATIDVGLGHLALGRATRELSGGERQRLSLAAGLLAQGERLLYLLDEPATGLHEADLQRLAAILQRLAAQGHLIVAAEHRRSLIAAADERIELGPGSGPAGGRLVAVD